MRSHRSRRIVQLLMGVLLASPLVASQGAAGDGRFEINQVCATQTGCFSGDTPGFPVQINASGSYVLTSNLEVTANGTVAIGIQPPNTPSVAIDLNGFQIRGPVVCSETGSGVSCTPSPTTGAGINANGNYGVTVRNGIIRGFNNGLNLGSEAVVEDMIIYSNANTAITGGRMAVRDVVASLNGGNGVDVDRTSQLTGIASVKNGNVGLRGRAGATRMEMNLLWQNYGGGLFCNTGCTLRRNLVIGNGFHGIWTNPAGSGSWIEGNLISTNADYAISTDSTTGFRNNVIQWNTGAHGVTGGVYLHPNLCAGGQSDAACRFEP